MAADPDHLLRGDDAPPTLPLLPVRNTVLFPGVVLPVTVARKKSVKLVRKAYAADKLLGVVAQRNPDAAEPGTDELHPVGTLARILKLLEQPDGQITIILQGQVRFSIEEQLTFTPLVARVSLLPRSSAEPRNPGEFGLLQALREAATKVLELTPEIPMEARSMLDGIQSPAFLTHFLSSNVQLDLPAKQRLLELADPEAAGPPAARSPAEPGRAAGNQAGHPLENPHRHRCPAARVFPAPAAQNPAGRAGPGRPRRRRGPPARPRRNQEVARGGGPALQKGDGEAGPHQPHGARLLGEHQLRRVPARPALGRVHQGQIQPQANQENPRRRPFRPRKGEGAHSRIHCRAQAEAGFESADSVPLRPARRGQNQPWAAALRPPWAASTSA